MFGKIGRADTATDPAPFSMAETTIRLKPRAEWPQASRTSAGTRAGRGPRSKRVLGWSGPRRRRSTTAELVERLDRTTRFPGWTNAWTAPVRARMDMMSTGVRTPVGIRIVADDPARLDALGAAVRAAVRSAGHAQRGVRVAGRRDAAGVRPRRAALARHEVDPALVRATADLFISGGRFGELRVPETPLDAPLLLPSQINAGHAGHAHGHGHDDTCGREQERRRATPLPPRQADWERRTAPAADRPPVPVRVSLAARWHPKPPEQLLRDVTVRGGDGDGQPVPLALLGRPTFVSAPAQLRTEHGELVGYVYVDLDDGTDIARLRRAGARSGRRRAGAPARPPAARRAHRVDRPVRAAGRRPEAPQAHRARRGRCLMLGLLLLQFRSLTEALIVLVSVPFALVGSFWTLYLLGYPLSAPVWVGLLSVVGLAMQTGVVMVVYIDEAFHRRVREGQMRSRDDIVAAHAEGTVLRLRPRS